LGSVLRRGKSRSKKEVRGGVKRKKSTPVTPISENKSKTGGETRENRSKKEGEAKENRSENRSTPRKRKGPHVKNRMKVRTFALEYQSKHGKWPTYKLIKSSCRVGETVISEVMKELKRSKAA
jgi:hypothetical protein